MKLTPGAMRAAEKIKKNEQFDLTIEEIAAIIDADTGAADLLDDLRDRFAGQVLAALITAPDIPVTTDSPDSFSLDAYIWADAMLLEREKRSPDNA